MNNIWWLRKTLYKYFILDESELIDWEKGSDSTDRCDESEKDDSLLEISDSDSCTNLNSLPVKEENDELCKVRNCFKFKEKKKASAIIMECIHIWLHLIWRNVRLLLTLSLWKKFCTQEFQGIFSDCQTSKPSSAPHVELGSVTESRDGWGRKAPLEVA